MNNKEKRYGQNKLAYGVAEKQDRGIELRIYHQNRAVRKMITNNSDHPRISSITCSRFQDQKPEQNYGLCRFAHRLDSGVPYDRGKMAADGTAKDGPGGD